MPPPEVGVVILHARPATLTAELPGRTAPYRISEVRPQVNGLVLKRLFTEGSQVKAGQPLYQIDPAPYQAAYNNASAALTSSRTKAQRFGQLLKANAVAPQDYDDAVAAYKQAAANVQSARINLGYTRITAPISGRIGLSTVTEGALVTSGQAADLTTIQMLDPIYVNIPQSSTQTLALRQAVAKGELDKDTPAITNVGLWLEDGSKYPLTGKLQFADVTVDTGTGSVTLRAIFPNPHRILLPGMYVRAIIGEGIVPNAILAPQQGIIRDTRGEPTAWVVGKNNTAELRTLQVSRSVENDWLVTSGLKDGDRLIVEGTQNLRPGIPVRAVPAAIRPDRMQTPH
ncbi:MAG: efflux RND transporter periplasmic adaptor subunit [Alphaproteobacteria bacterium]|jgi:membrane fusion protein (multidrug efflux system)